ncbi:MAG: gamma-glutamyltransferase [Flavobacteriaceae bacterium]|nr:gamma-glutamyltransferase [Flavobacteriaceae bacterium]
MSKSVLFSILAGLLLVSCQEPLSTAFKNSTIAAAHPLASQAGKKMYEQQGNAFDAAVAAGFALAVVEPSMSGIGGRLQAIYHKSSGKVGGVDASTQVPINYKPTEEKYSHGYQTIGIPGVVAGLLKLHKEHGSLPLEKVLQPAIAYAENGFKILPGEAFRQQMAKEVLQQYEGTKTHFLNAEGASFQAGDQVVQKTLASVLKKIASNGKAGFYEGEVAQKIVDDIQANGGLLTLEDLKNYEALNSEVLEGSFQGLKVFALNLPSFGAITIQILQILDHLSPPDSEEDWAVNIGEATELAYTYRKSQVNRDSLAKILSYDQAAIWANQIEKNRLNLVAENTSEMPGSWVASMGHTTHLTAADEDGNVVSLTQTVGPNMGSKVASKELGFIYAVTLGGYLGEYKPGDRSNSHISPTLFMNGDQVALAIGAAGGSRIVTAVTQVADRYLAQKHDLNHALLLPRVYPFQDSLWIEDHQEVQQLNANLDESLYPIKMISQKARFGRVHAVALDTISGTWIGAADPDWEGTVENHVSK